MTNREKIFVFEYITKTPRKPEKWGIFFSETLEEAIAYAKQILDDFPKHTKLVSVRCIGEWVGDFCQIEKGSE